MLKNLENTIRITKNAIHLKSWIPTFLAYSSSGVVDFKHSNRNVFVSALKIKKHLRVTTRHLKFTKSGYLYFKKIFAYLIT